MAKNFAISGQHYLFNVQAFAHTILTLGGETYDYAFREEPTADVIQDVSDGSSELGVIMQTQRTKSVIDSELDKAGLEFVPLKESRPCIALPASHPLSSAESLSLDQLDGWPYVYFEQRAASPLEFAEEALSNIERSKTIGCSDRASLSELIVALNGYTITSGILVGITDGGSLSTVPLECDETLCLGYVIKKGAALSPAAEHFVRQLAKELEIYAK